MPNRALAQERSTDAQVGIDRHSKHLRLLQVRSARRSLYSALTASAGLARYPTPIQPRRCARSGWRCGPDGNTVDPDPGLHGARLVTISCGVNPLTVLDSAELQALIQRLERAARDLRGRAATRAAMLDTPPGAPQSDPLYQRLFFGLEALHRQIGSARKELSQRTDARRLAAPRSSRCSSVLAHRADTAVAYRRRQQDRPAQEPFRALRAFCRRLHGARDLALGSARGWATTGEDPNRALFGTRDRL